LENLANLPLIFADVLDKFVKLYATEFMAKQLCKTLATPNFCRLWYIHQKILATIQDNIKGLAVQGTVLKKCVFQID